MISFVRTYLSWPISAAPEAKTSCNDSGASRRGVANVRLKLERRHCEPTGRANARPMTGSAKPAHLRPALIQGWVERLVRRSSMSDLSAVARRAKAEGGSDTHQLHLMVMMGFAGLNLSTRSTRSPDAAQRHQRVYARIRRAMTCGVVRC